MPFSGWADLQPEFADRARRFCAATDLVPTSGYRSSERQAQLYRCFQHCTPDCNGQCNPANPPGTSWHEFGFAIDADAPGANEAEVAANYDAAHQIATEFGVWFAIAKERWHFQALECRSSAHVSGSPLPTLRRWFPPPRRSDDDMATIEGYVLEDPDGDSIPCPPAGGGESGALKLPDGSELPGYANDVYVSLSSGKERSVDIQIEGDLNGVPKVVSEREPITIGPGRRVVTVLHPPEAGKPWPNAVTIWKQGGIVRYFIEWARPQPPA